MKKKHFLLNAVIVMLTVIVCTGCSKTSTQTNYQDTDFAMGTVISQNIYGKNGENLSEKILDIITNLENIISWRIDGTEVNTLNKVAGEGGISAENDKLPTWLNQCAEVYEKSGGLLDITVGPAARLWDIGGDNPRIPEEDELEEALQLIDGSKVHVDGQLITFDTKNGQLDLGAVGKGIACDEISDYLSQSQIEVNGTFSVGGSVLIYGAKPNGQAWKIGIQDPREEEGTYMGALEISQEEGESIFVSTSGDYEKYFEEDGVRYHHILDPHTGCPADSGLISVTIISESGFLTDALSTACFVAGKDEGMKLAEEFGVDIIVIDEEKNVYASEGAKEYFSLLSDDYNY